MKTFLINQLPYKNHFFLNKLVKNSPGLIYEGEISGRLIFTHILYRVPGLIPCLTLFIQISSSLLQVSTCDIL